MAPCFCSNETSAKKNVVMQIIRIANSSCHLTRLLLAILYVCVWVILNNKKGSSLTLTLWVYYSLFPLSHTHTHFLSLPVILLSDPHAVQHGNNDTVMILPDCPVLETGRQESSESPFSPLSTPQRKPNP